MEKYIALKGKNVADRNGNIIGSVDSLLIDTKNRKVNSLIISNMMFVKSFYIIPLECIKSFREPLRFDRTIYRIRKSMLLQNKRMILKNYIDLEIVDKNGTKLGNLLDCIFDTYHGDIKALIASGGFFEDIFEGRKIILVNKGTVFDLEKILVDEYSLEIKHNAFLKKYLKE